MAEVKTPRLEVLFIPLERPWNVDVENGLPWAIQTSVTQVMVKRKVGSQTGSLTPDHKKSGIDPILVCADGVRHTIGKKALEESYKFASDLIPIRGLSRELWAPKVPGVSTRTVSKLLLWVPGIKAIWMPVRWGNAKNTIWGKVVASPESGPLWVKWVRVACGLSQHQGCFQRWTNRLVVGFDAGPSN